MQSTLDRTRTAAVLDRLLATEQRSDPAAFAEAGLEEPSQFPNELSLTEQAERTKDIHMSVSRDGGELLYLLARGAGAANVVEFGTSFGVSTLYLAAAVRDNGGGRVVTTEAQPDKAAAARAAFAEAGLDDLVELRFGDARETLRELPGGVDLVLLDGFPGYRLDVLRVVEPRLRAGAMVLVDDIDLDFGTDTTGDFLSYVEDSANGYRTSRLPVGDGLQLCIRLGTC